MLPHLHRPRSLTAVLTTACVLALAVGCSGAGGDGVPATTGSAASVTTIDGAGAGASASTAGSPATPPVPSQTFTTLPPQQRPRIAVVGDSLTHTATPELLWQLRHAGWEVTTIDGTIGAPIADRVRVVRALASGDNLDAIVLALGSNDARLNVDTGRDVGAAWAATQSAAFTALAEAQTVPCVVWVGVNANTTTWQLDQWGAWFNAWLRYYAHHADWTATSAGHPEWFLADGVHLTGAGNEAYARLVVDTVGAECLPTAP